MTAVLLQEIQTRFSTQILAASVTEDHMPTITIARESLIEVAEALHTEAAFDFKLLLDVCGVDYAHYGQSEWRTTETTATGFSRGASPVVEMPQNRPRFAVVYHLLSLTHNHRLRLRVELTLESLEILSVYRIWNSANWYEREAFDLYGIVFVGHPDLRRLLTDYGFVGHPFRKDFPLIGTVELRFDANAARCVYEPVSITPRVTVPKVIRSDNRYDKVNE